MPPRVCFVSLNAYGYFNPEYGFTGGGAERQFYLLSTALAEELDVHVVVGDYGQPERERNEGVTLHRAYPLQARHHPLQPVKHFWLLGDAMRRADADNYVHRGAPDNAGFVYLWARLLRARFIYHVANDEHVAADQWTTSTLRWRLFTHALRHAGGLGAQTDRQQRVLNDRFGRDATVVPNAYPNAGAPPAHCERGYVLWVGRIERDQKQPHIFLDLAEQLPSVQFRLVGPPDDDEYERTIAERAATLDNVTYVGAVAPDEVHGEYRNAVALVNTSAYEGFPNTFLEAWRQGTPVVSIWTDHNRFLDDSVPDTYADGDIQQAADLLGKLTADEAYWQTVSERSRQYFETAYSIDSVAEKYAALLRAVGGE